MRAANMEDVGTGRASGRGNRSSERAAKLFRTVSRELFPLEKQGCLPWSPDLSTKEVASRHLLRNIIRKFEGDGGVSAEAAVLARLKFHASNHSCSEPPPTAVNTCADESLLDEFQFAVDRFFGACVDRAIITDNMADHFNRGKPGPGASVAASGTDIYHKMFDSAVSVTPGLLPAWEYLTTNASLGSLADAFFVARHRHGLRVVDGNNVSVVHKTSDVGRTIGTEPSANMWMQLGLSAQFEDGLRWWFGVDLSNQPDRNRLLAQVGSQSLPGYELATLDLESASDLLSLDVAGRHLPQWLFAILCRYRSPYGVDEGQTFKLHMLSSMGNGFTFSLMTIIMCCIVHAAARSSGVKLTRWDGARPGNWGVFGDDIICPSSIVPRVTRLLSLLGYRINHSKSFVEGPFRESCGGDYYRGVNIRPVFVRHLSTRADLLVVFNRLVAWSALHQVNLVHSLRLIAKWLGKRNFVPLHEAEDAGIMCPAFFLEATGLFDHEFDSNLSFEYTAWVSRPKTVAPGSCTESRFPNSAGLFCAALFGTLLPGGTLAVRHDRDQLEYRTTRRVTPGWDHRCPAVGELSPPLGRLVTVLESALL